jgi:hypothetical protein
MHEVERRKETSMKQWVIAFLCLCLAPASLCWAGSPPASDQVDVPAGAEVAIRTNQAIDSKNAAVGQTFPAEVAEDVPGSSGQILIPRGSEASLVLRQVSNGGTFGSPELTLDLDSVTIGGKRYVVNTAELQQGSKQGLGKNRRTAEMVGGGTALGTLLGAVAGGGKGALIGAIAGAAAGGTVQVVTKGKDVRVPAETVLKFKLDQALHLQASE